MTHPNEQGPLATASVHEALGRIGALPARLKPAYPKARLSGPAFTVSCPAGDNLRLHHAILRAQPGDILVVAVEGDREYGYWGEILSVAAQARGLGGLLIDGGVRDVNVLGDTGFPVFSAGTCIRGTGKNPALSGSFGRQIQIGNITISPGDLVLGDSDGVCIVPAPQAATAGPAALARDAKEVDIIKALQAGQTTVEIYDLPDMTHETVGVTS